MVLLYDELSDLLLVQLLLFFLLVVKLRCQTLDLILELVDDISILLNHVLILLDLHFVDLFLSLHGLIVHLLVECVFDSRFNIVAMDRMPDLFGSRCILECIHSFFV